MMLYESEYESFVLMNRTSGLDEYGGLKRGWTEGATIQAAATLDTSIEARVAGVQGLTSVYTVYTSRAVTLEYHDVIKRVSDGLILRVTSDGKDKRTPASAGLDLRLVTAEEWSLTDG